mmetsp:Transcript_1340/g.4224  ORF Transcript_1340/g.4224 Transcript_1340/m.4224 type:complete len:203 (+) Transcript_1340:765-1373(+)
MGFNGLFSDFFSPSALALTLLTTASRCFANTARGPSTSSGFTTLGATSDINASTICTHGSLSSAATRMSLAAASAIEPTRESRWRSDSSTRGLTSDGMVDHASAESLSACGDTVALRLDHPAFRRFCSIARCAVRRAASPPPPPPPAPPIPPPAPAPPAYMINHAAGRPVRRAPPCAPQQPASRSRTDGGQPRRRPPSPSPT